MTYQNGCQMGTFLSSLYHCGHLGCNLLLNLFGYCFTVY